jgi:hypothetical protein
VTGERARRCSFFVPFKTVPKYERLRTTGSGAFLKEISMPRIVSAHPPPCLGILAKKPKPASRQAPFRKPPLLYWQPVAAAVVITLVLVVTLSVATRPGYSSPQDAPVVSPLIPEDDAVPSGPVVEPVPVTEVPVARAARKAGPDDAGMPLAVLKPALFFSRADERLTAQPGKPTFGTAVQFERNPSEAALVAEKEGKLLFLLHVSGDFEESEFT